MAAEKNNDEALALALAEKETVKKDPPVPAPRPAPRDPKPTPSPAPTGRPALPNQFMIDFFSPRSLHRSKTINVDPAQIKTFVGMIYDQMEQLCVNQPPILRADYIRMCQSLFLKRIQDVHEKCFNKRAESFVRLYRNITVPKPLYDLMSAIGKGFDSSDGYHYYMTPVAKPTTAAPAWWIIDDVILTNYTTFSRRMSTLYMHCEFPSSNDFDGRAFGTTKVVANGPLHAVYSTTPTPTPADGLLRVINPDALLTGDVPTAETCGFRLCDDTHLSSVRLAYLGASVLTTNS